jgi:FlgN protein
MTELQMTELLGHLDRQVTSARKLLGIVLAQTEAIKRQNVESLLARMAEVQLEMRTRELLEQERDALIRGAAARLGMLPAEIDIEAILRLVPAPSADEARMLSAELRGLLHEIGQVHTVNRVLIRQELSFLDHLMRVVSGAPQAGYSSAGWTHAPQAANVVNTRV